MISTQRIRCNFCNRRIPASSVVCPNCQRNPRAFYWKPRHVVVLVAVLALLGLGAVYFFLNNVGGLIPTGIALAPSPTVATPRPPITVILVATAVPATRTALPPTVAPTLTPTAPPPTTVVPTKPPTATRDPESSATAAPEPTETASPIPTPVPVQAPALVSPNDGDRISGPNKNVILTFQPAQSISLQEWYRVQVDFLDRAGNPVSWCGFTKESALEFPREFFDDSSPNVRSFLWRVNVVSSTQLVPVTCDAPYEILSAPSEVWTFLWY